MKTLLLCGYRFSSAPDADPLGLTRDAQGTILLDLRLRQLQELGTEPVCVLSGANADEQLRRCPRLADVEIVFDTNDGEVSLATNLKAGLAALDGEACYVLPVEIPPPDAAGWRHLRENSRREQLQGEVSLVQAHTPEGAPWHFGFPLLVTRFGNAEIRRLQGFRSLLDTRLKYLHIVFEGQSDVASQAQDL